MPDRRSPTRRRLPAAERRELIEQAALALFTERGYHGTAVDAIARKAGVTPPVVYDHFDSKAGLHRRLLERTRDELLEMWRSSLGGGGPLQEQVARAFAAWAAYVQAHPYAPRMFFRETTGVPEIQAVHAAIAEDANRSLTQIVAGLLGDSGDPQTMTMATEVIRGGLTELAIWWSTHPDVEADAIVATAMNTVWVGFERLSRGDRWP